jgi:flagellar secretion chaperone FliS
MSNKAGYFQYKKTAIESASREKLLLMMYEGAIKFTKKAIMACEQKNIAERGMNIGRAYDIIMELNNTLDHKIGGELSKNLEQLYMFMTDQLVQANIKGDAEPLRHVLKLLEILNEGWVKAVEQLKNEKQENANQQKLNQVNSHEPIAKSRKG